MIIIAQFLVCCIKEIETVLHRLIVLFFPGCAQNPGPCV